MLFGPDAVTAGAAGPAPHLEPGLRSQPSAGAPAPEGRRGGPDVRTLRRVRVEEGATGRGDPGASRVAVVVDCETTGLGEEDVVVELAARQVRFDEDGVVTCVGRRFSWLEDPGRPMPPAVTRLTGIADADVAGMAIDDRMATAVISGADLVIAHNARFDRRHVVRRLPGVSRCRWACSSAEVDWAARGLEGRALGWLVAQVGLFHDGHRAGDDVDALIALLQHRFDDGATVLSDLLASSAREGWLVRAVGAAFSRKDALKARGYAWDPDAKAWWREVTDDAREAEEWWLAANIYAFDHAPRALGPEIDRITSRERWR